MEQTAKVYANICDAKKMASVFRSIPSPATAT